MFVFIVGPDGVSLANIISYRVDKALVGYDPAISDLSGEFTQQELDEKYGIYKELMLITHGDGYTRQYPVDTQVVDTAGHDVDKIIRSPGKYQWDGKKFGVSPGWKEPKIVLGEKGEKKNGSARSRK